MPFDGRKFNETKPDVFSLPSIIAWLEKQPPEIEYCFDDNGHCLLASYFRANGFRSPYVTTGGVREGGHRGELTLFPGADHWLGSSNPLNDIAQGHPRTFKAALDRAREILASS